MIGQLFEAYSVQADAKPDDILVSWPVSQKDSVKLSLLTEESLEHARKENEASLSDGQKKHYKHAILRNTSGFPSSFLVEWANNPYNAKKLDQNSYRGGHIIPSGLQKTKDILKISIPVPTSDQVQEMTKILKALNQFEELLDLQRKAIDTREDMVKAIHHELLSGKISISQAKQHLMDAMGHAPNQDGQTTPTKKKPGP